MHLTPLDDALAYRLQRVARRLRYDLAAKLVLWSDTDLTPEQYFTLYRLGHGGPLPMQALADPVLEDHPNVSRVVAGLQRRGLVTRARDARDRRIQRVTLTAKGKALVERLHPKVQAERRRLFSGWPADELQAWAAGLARLEALVE
jgi:DNA-binding MarR family transcriptional regulator